MSEIDWKSKAEEMEDTYKELYKLRVESVNQDIEELMQKINEHSKIHQLAVNEMKYQNNQLRAKIEENKRNKQNISQLESSIIEKRRQLSRKDPILAKIFQFSNLHILRRNSDGTRYLVGHGDEYQYQFEISKIDSNSFQYQGVQVPEGIYSDGDENFKEWAYETISIKASDLALLLSICSKAEY